MEKYKFKTQKLVQDTAERKVRFKLYKAGTRWLVAGMATLTSDQVVLHYQTGKADAAPTDGSDAGTTKQM